MDNSSSLVGSYFNVKTFIHSNVLGGVLAINSECELSDTFTGVELNQFGPKGNLHKNNKKL